MFFFSPFDPFITIPFTSYPIINLFFFSNITYCLFLLLLFVLYLIYLVFNKKEFKQYLIPTNLESLIFLIYLAFQALLEKHVHGKTYQQILYPISFSIGFFLFLLNLSGNLPNYISLTSQFAVVTILVLSIYIASFVWFLYDRKISLFRAFFAPGTSLFLAMLLFPIELITFLMRPVSVICRLCANIMSGHIIVKVGILTICGLNKLYLASSFCAVFGSSTLLFQVIPILLLELCVSVIQVYVFLVIWCMFLNDVIGHHYRI